MFAQEQIGVGPLDGPEGRVKMRTVELHETAGPDGALRLTIPANRAGARYRVTILVEDETPGEPTAIDANGWPVGFIESTAGAWQGEFPRIPFELPEERPSI